MNTQITYPTNWRFYIQRGNSRKTAIPLLVYLIFFDCIIFQPLFEDYFHLSFFSYIDDAIVPLSFLLFIYMFITGRHIKCFRPLVLGILILLIGLLGNVLNSSQVIQAIALDSNTILKPFCAYTLFYNIGLKSKENKNSKKIIRKNLYGLFLAFLFCFAINLTTDIFPKYTRWGFLSMGLFYNENATLGEMCLLLICCQVMFGKKSIFSYLMIAFYFLLSILTLRIKIIAMLAIFPLLYLLVIKKRKKMNLKLIFFLLIILCVLGQGQIKYYFFSVNSFKEARYQLLRGGLLIAKRFFPLGSGLGTFGSNASAVFYSDIYYQLGLDSVYGLGGQNISFIMDSFWPMILGETGYLGFAIFILFVCFLYKSLALLFLKNRYSYFSCLFLFIYLVVSSVNQTIFVSSSGILFISFLSINEGIHQKQNSVYKNKQIFIGKNYDII